MKLNWESDIEFEVKSPSGLILFQSLLEISLLCLIFIVLSSRYSILKIGFLNKINLSIISNSGTAGVIVISGIIIAFAYLTDSSIDLIKNHYKSKE